MIAANMYVNDVLEGVTNHEESVNERKLIPRDWQHDHSTYERVASWQWREA